MAKKDSSIERQENDKVRESSTDTQGSDRLRSESCDPGLGSKRNTESAAASKELENQGIVPNLSIDSNGTSVSNEAEKENGKQTDNDTSKKTDRSDSLSVLNNPNASYEDKIRAATDLANSGQDEFKGADGRNYSIQTKDYGRRTGTVVSTTDSNGKFMPVLRGLVDGQGNVTQQQYDDGRKADFAGDRAQKALDNSNVLGNRSSDTPPETNDKKYDSDRRGSDAGNKREIPGSGDKIPESPDQESQKSLNGDSRSKNRDSSAEDGKNLAKIASQMASRINTVGDCAKGPRKTFDQLGFHLPRLVATEQGKMIEKSGLFKEVPLSEARPGDYGYRHWNSQVTRAHGGVDKGDSFIVTGRDSRGNLHAANDHKFVVPPDGGRYRGLKILRPTEEFFKRYPLR